MIKRLEINAYDVANVFVVVFRSYIVLLDSLVYSTFTMLYVMVCIEHIILSLTVNKGVCKCVFDTFPE